MTIFVFLGNWRKLPGAAGEFEGFADGEEEFFREGAADELDADGEAFGGS